jgi:hypothetical protein
MVCKETACTTCAHREVCKLSEEFLKAQKAVDGVSVHLGEGRMKELRFFDYIKPVELRCTHYHKAMEVTLR